MIIIHETEKQGEKSDMQNPVIFDDAYPVERIQQTEAFLRDLWRGSEKTAFSAYPSEPNYRQMADAEEMAQTAAQNILLGANIPGHNIPRLIADFGTVTTAAYWGGRRHTLVGGCIGIDPVFETADDLDSIQPKDASTCDVARGVALWQRTSEILRIDRLPCTMIDIQSPLNTAALLWRQEEFMMAMYKY